MALFIICYLTHWEAWEDVPLIWKHEYSLPAGGNCFVLCNSTGAISSVGINGVKRVVVHVAWTLYICLWCYTWLDVICIWGVVIVLIFGNFFVTKLRRDRCSCRITCRLCMIGWRWQNRFLECWSGFFWSIIFVKTTNILYHDVN